MDFEIWCYHGWGVRTDAWELRGGVAGEGNIERARGGGGRVKGVFFFWCTD